MFKLPSHSPQKMETVILTTCLISQAVSQTLWFSIGPGGSKPFQTVALVGPNQEYVIQGQATSFTTYTVCWEAGSRDHLGDKRPARGQLQDPK